LIETVAERAILSGKERIDAESFADRAMTLPLVAMTRSLERRGGAGHAIRF